jgi:hypothetical protein
MVAPISTAALSKYTVVDPCNKDPQPATRFQKCSDSKWLLEVPEVNRVPLIQISFTISLIQIIHCRIQNTFVRGMSVTTKHTKENSHSSLLLCINTGDAVSNRSLAIFTLAANSQQIINRDKMSKNRAACNILCLVERMSVLRTSSNYGDKCNM